MDGSGTAGAGTPLTPVLDGPGGAPVEFVDVAAGAEHVCGVLTNGSMACFGAARAPLLRMVLPLRAPHDQHAVAWTRLA